MLGCGEHAAEERIDDRIEDEVVDCRRAREKARVTEEHVVQLVHDEHQELLRSGGPGVHERAVHEETRLRAALDGRGLDAVGLDHVDQAEESAQAVRAAREGVEDAPRQRRHDRLHPGGMTSTTRRPGRMAARLGSLSRR